MGRVAGACHSRQKLKTAAVTRGDVVETVSSTGTVEPEELVDVSADVSGRIASFGPDPRGEKDPKFKGATIDYNSPVEPGTVLARIDNRVYKLQFEQAQAGLERAKAELSLAKSQHNTGIGPAAAVAAAEATVAQSRARRRASRNQSRRHRHPLARQRPDHFPARQCRPGRRNRPQRSRPFSDRQGSV